MWSREPAPCSAEDRGRLRAFDQRGTTGEDVTNLRRKVYAVDSALMLAPNKILTLKFKEVHLCTSVAGYSLRLAGIPM
jgi:hypothetical protein